MDKILVPVDFSNNSSNNRIDDYPFGGGAGMLMKPEPIFEAIKSIRTFAKIDDILDVRAPGVGNMVSVFQWKHIV